MYSKIKFSLNAKFAFIVLIVSLCFSNAWAQGQPDLAGRWEGAINLPGTALGIGIDFSKKADGTWQGEQLRAFVDSTMKSWKVPGLAMAIVKDGEVIFSEGFGVRNVEAQLPVTPNTLFAIGSCSKAFTAACIGILVDDGKVEWDKPVRDYLPTFKLHDDFATARMTPRDLVTHRSGLPRHDLLWYGSSFTRKEMFDRLQYLEPSKDLRTTYQYQNLTAKISRRVSTVLRCRSSTGITTFSARRLRKIPMRNS